MVQLEIGASNDHGLFTTLLRLDASFTMTPRANSSSRRNPVRVLRPKPENCLPVVLRPKPPNPLGEAYLLCFLHVSTRVTVVLNHPAVKSSSAFA